MGTQRKAAGKRKLVNPPAILASLVLAAVTATFVIALTEAEDIKPPMTGNRAIEILYPQNDDLDLRQSRIGLDLKDDYVFDSLEINKVVIPNDQLDAIAPLNQFLYIPAPGKEIGQLPAGRHCATASFYRFGDPEKKRLSHTWCFVLH